MEEEDETLISLLGPRAFNCPALLECNTSITTYVQVPILKAFHVIGLDFTSQIILASSILYPMTGFITLVFQLDSFLNSLFDLYCLLILMSNLDLTIQHTTYCLRFFLFVIYS